MMIKPQNGNKKMPPSQIATASEQLEVENNRIVIDFDADFT